eukprot:12883672-Prorocentrum_lima.AAC.1
MLCCGVGGWWRGGGNGGWRCLGGCFLGGDGRAVGAARTAWVLSVSIAWRMPRTSFSGAST